MPDESASQSTRTAVADGGKIADYRNNLGLTQEEFGKKVKCSKNTIWMAENRQPVGIRILRRIARLMKLKYADLLLEGAQNEPDSGDADITVGGTLLAVTPVSDFVGRLKEQDDILSHLKGGGRVCISAIKAAGGMGKTQLAAKCTEQLRDAFPHVLWLRLDGMTNPKSPAALLQEVIRYFSDNPAEKLPDAVGDLIPLYLAALHGRRALVVLDNAKDLAQVKPLFDPAVPNTVAFLATSRNRIVITGDAKSIDLELLSEPDAVALLRGIVNTPARGTDDEWKAVAKLCGRLPLALRIAGTFLRDKANWSLERYITALRTEPLRQLDLGTDDENVGRVLSLSVRQLVADNAEQAGRFQMLSVFPGDFDADAAAAVWELDEDDTFGELDDLTDRSLVEFDAATDRYHLHDLMQPVARDAFVGRAEQVRRTASPAVGAVADGGAPFPDGKDRPALPDGSSLAAGSDARLRLAEQRFTRHYLTVLERIDELEESKDPGILVSLKLFDREQHNIRRGQAWAAGRFQADPTDRLAAQMAACYPITGVFALALRLSARDEKIPWLTAAVSAAKQLGQKQWQGAALGGLGNAWYVLDDPQRAIGFYEQHLIIAREMGDRRGEGRSLGNLGFAWAALGDRQRAIGLYGQVLPIMREVGDRRGEGNALGGLGLAWAGLGDARKAIGFYDQQLVIAREVGDRRGEGVALGNLGIAWAGLGDPQRAIRFYDQRLVIAHEIGDRDGEANTRWNKALVLDSLCRRAEAIPLVEAALRFWEEIGHPFAEMIRQAIAKWKAAAG